MEKRDTRDQSMSAKKKELLALLLEEEGFHTHQKQTIVPRKMSGSPPLSFAQQRLWFLNQLAPGNSFYNVPGLIRLKGCLDAALLERSLNEIVRRHDALRTSFPERDGKPHQLIISSLNVPLPVVDLQGLAESEREAIARQLARAEARQPFDLCNGPLIRVTLLRLAEREHVLLLDMHHIICDGWSMGVFFTELAALYEAYRMEQPSPLPPLPVQYTDYALWQREWLEDQVQYQQMRYWRQQLEHAPTLLELPADFSRPALQSFQGAAEMFTLSPELTKKIHLLGQQTGTTVFMVLLATFDVLLYRYTGQTDLIVGTPIANRRRPEIEGLIGFFVNTLAMRVNLDGNPTFLALLERVKEVALGAYAHQDLPFERLVEELQPERHLSHTPLVQVLFAVQNARMEPQQIPGLTLHIEAFDEGTAPFDLSLFFTERGAAFEVALVYSTDLFAPSSMQRLVQHLCVLLEAVIASPQQRISDLPILSEAERESILRTWNQNRLDFPREFTPQQLFEVQAAQTPDATALVFQGMVLTYAELNRRSNQLAQYLRAQHVGPEVPVGLCIERSLEMVIGILGILKAGGAYVPLDPDYPRERLAFILSDIQAPILVTQEHLRERLPAENTSILCLDSAWEVLAQERPEAPRTSVHASNPGYVIYTSGSTGRPKGVTMCLHTFTNLVLWQQAYFPGTPRTLQFAPISFDVSAQEIFVTLCSGSTLIIASQEQRRDPERLLDVLREQRIERLFVPFVALQALAETLEQADVLPDDVHEIFTAGEQLRLTQPIRHLLARLNCHLHNNYGPSESHVVTFYTLPRPIEACPHFPPIGQPIANGAMYLLDKHLQPVPIGVPGEIYIGGELLLARGYLNRPDLSAERFIPNLFSQRPGERLYRTGDLARYLSDGMIDFIGRIDFQVKVRGYRIELGEIEVVLGQHPAVQEVVVTVREEHSNTKQLIAYLIPEPGQTPHGNELRRYLLERLPEYMIPAAFIPLKAWPLTASGKIDRRALPAPGTEYWSGSEATVVAPRDPIEEALVDIWAQVLGQKPGGIYHNFFESGGHSLLATQVISRVRSAFQIELPLRTLFEAPNIASLGQHIREAVTGESSGHIPQLQPRIYAGNPPMSFAQQRMWVLDQLLPGNPSYNMSGGLHLRGTLDVVALERSLNEIVSRHEALRTRFDMQQGQPVQIIMPALPIPFLLVDMRGIAGTAREIALEHITNEEANRAFDLHQGPLIHAVLVCLSAKEHTLLLCLHHIVCDGWSLGVFFGELTTLYEAFLKSKPSPLPLLPLQYADYALWQREWLQGEMLETQLAYWRQTLARLAPLELPTDHPRPLVQTLRGAVQNVQVPYALSQDLKALAQREGVTLFMLLLAAFQVVLARYSGQEDIAVGTPIANRNRAESEDLIGCFVNTLVLRGDLSGNPSIRAFLHRVREVCLGAYAHQDLPFEKIVDELQPERDLSRSPLFQVLFALQNLPMVKETLPGLQVVPLNVELETVKLDLSLTLSETVDGLVGSLRYCSDLFEAATIERMMHHWQHLLEGLVRRPEARLSEVPLLTEEEERHLLIEWNVTQGDDTSTQESNLPRRFEEQVAQRSDAIALVSEAGSLTYGDLNSRANQLASYLRKLGVGPEKTVGLWMETSPELLSGLLGTLKAGGAYVPLDPETPPERLHFLLRDAAINILLTRRPLLKKLGPELEIPALCLEEIGEALALESEEGQNGPISPEVAAYVLYTSGSTGQPKGVVVAHRQALNYAEAIKQQVGLKPGASYALLQPLTVDSSLTMLWGALLTGGRLLLITKEQGLDPEELATAFAREPVEYLKIAPSHLAALLAGKEPERIVPRRALIIGGEASRWKWAQEVSLFMPEGRMYNHYGPTEATVGVLTYHIEAYAQATGTHSALTPLGKPLRKNQVYVLDNWMRPVPVGVSGEVFIGGEQVARGYLSRSVLTAERFVPDPYGGEAGARLYRTGDVARYRDDGVLEFVGRKDEQVKIRGYRVEPGEIEAVLNLHPQVREALVIAHQTATEAKHLVAYVLAEEEGNLASQDILRFVRERLPEYMVPVALVTLTHWPHTPHGKIDRRALPVPAMTHSLTREAATAPRTTLEKLLADIWAKLLGLEHIGIHDNFFELGGDSILSIRVVAQARQAGLHFTPRQLFQAQNIAALAALIGPQSKG
ncbi:MAG: amino acid adenylation domain-containing protein, partial [Ktedonobacteraceae bacterium]|nr:amino acid adenylation domain-containing protein [Ktedonobacteraceae bacterium]